MRTNGHAAPFLESRIASAFANQNIGSEKQARTDLGDKKYKQVLSCLPQYDDLDIELMREAEYAFA